jgi:hypothetical protein
MLMRIVRPRLRTLLIVGALLLGGGFTREASAVVFPPEPNGVTIEYVYYSDASHTTEVGYSYYNSCFDTSYQEGIQTAYYTKRRGFCY